MTYVVIFDNNNNPLSVTNHNDCILAMLLVSSRNGRLEVTQFSVPTPCGTVSVIQSFAKCNMSWLTAHKNIKAIFIPT